MRPFLFVIIMYGAVSVWAQVHSFFAVELQNDYFDCGGHGTDRYYTAGNRLQYLHVPTRQRLAYQVAIMQQAFTPIDLQDSSRRYTDHPYAGLLFMQGAVRYISTDSIWFSVFSLSMGTTGKSSGVASMQKRLHRLLGDEIPRGWNHILELGSYCQIEWSLLHELYSRHNNTIGLLQGWEWGTVYKRVQLGLRYQKGKLPTFNLGHFTLHPSNSLNGKSNRGWLGRLSFFMTPGITWVFSNKILEKGFFIPGISRFQYPKTVAVSKTVLGVEAGIGYQLKRVAFTYHQVWQQREFSTGLPHHYGSVAIIFSLH